MIINQSANIVTSLAVEICEGFKHIDEKFIDMKQYMDSRFHKIEEGIIFLKLDVKVLKEDVSALKKKLPNILILLNEIIWNKKKIFNRFC